MIQCPICSKFVPKFKTGAHIVPRWALSLTKENGQNLQIIGAKGKVNQTDPKTESWCEDCEKDFCLLDAYGAGFFRDNVDFESEEIDCFFHKIDNYSKISRFICSIVVRSYLYYLGTDRAASKDMLKHVFDAYVNKRDVYFYLYDMRKFLLSSSGYPAAGSDKIQFVINGYGIIVKLFILEKEYITTQYGKILVSKVPEARVHPFLKGFGDILRTARDNNKIVRSQKSV